MTCAMQIDNRYTPTAKAMFRYTPFLQRLYRAFLVAKVSNDTRSCSLGARLLLNYCYSRVLTDHRLTERYELVRLATRKYK